MRKTHGDPKADDIARNSLRKAALEEQFAQEMGSLISLDPSKTNSLSSFFASALGWKKNPANPSNTFSVAGEVREGLLEARRLTARQLDMVGRVKTTEYVTNLQKQLKQMLKSKNADPSLSDELLFDTIEVGHMPKNDVLYGMSPSVQQFQNGRYIKWQNRMSDLGFTQKEIEDLTIQAGVVASAFDEMRVVAASVGYDINKLEGLGYFPRVASTDFNLRMKDIGIKDNLGNEFSIGNTLSSKWDKARQTNHYIPTVHDDIVADFVGVTPDQLRDLLADPYEWRNFLHHNLSEAQLDDMVDSGMFAKLPMSGREVFEYMVKQYELPYEGLNDMFLTNPKQAIESYGNELREAVQNHAMIKTVVKDGMNSGWAITADQLASLPENLRKNFKALGSLPISKWYDKDELKFMGEVYVHRTVADQWKGILDVASSPVQMSNFSMAWRTLSGNLNKSVLLSQNVLYIGRIFLGNTIQAVAAGADLTRFVPAMYDIARVHKVGFDALDNTRKFAKVDGEWLTKRELFKRFYAHRGDTIAPQTPGIKTSGIRFDALNPMNAKKALGLMMDYSRAYGDPVTGIKRGAEYAGKLAQNMLDEAFAPFAFAGNYLDQVSKWMTLQSVVRRGDGVDLRQVVTTAGVRKFDTLKDALRHVDEYFFMYDDMGTVTSAVGRFVRPFASYAMANPPAQLRNALRQPEKYLAYHRLLQLWNYDETEGEVPEGGLAEYDHDNYPIALTYDKTNKEMLALMPNNYDPITDSFTFFRETGEKVARQFGVYTGTSQEQINQATGKEGFDKWLAETFKDTYYGKPAASLLGLDPMSLEPKGEEKFNTFLGVPMSSGTEAFLSFFPPIEAFNRWNPGGVFGKKAVEDSKGNVVSPAEPSVFGYSRTDNDSKQKAFERAGFATKALMALGANVRVIDVAKNMNWTYSELKNTHRELRTNTLKEQKELAMHPDKSSQEFESRDIQLRHKIAIEFEIQRELRRIEAWMYKNQVAPRDAVQEIKNRQVALTGEMPGAESRKAEARRELELRQDLYGEDHSKTLERLK